MAVRGENERSRGSEQGGLSAGLAGRARHGAILAQLGIDGANAEDADRFVARGLEQAVAGLSADLGSVLERSSQTGHLEVRAAVGWSTDRPGIGGPGASRSHAEFTLQGHEPVLIERLAAEARFAPGPSLAEHGVVSGMSVIMPGPGRPYGVLAVYTRSPRRFEDADVAFLQSVANVLAGAVQRAREHRELRDKHALLSAVTEHASNPDVVFVKDRERRFVWINPTGASSVGRRVEDVLGKTCDTLLPADIAMRICDDDNRVLDGETVTTEESFTLPGGSERTYVTVKRPHRDADGGIVGLIGHARDITARKRSERRLLVQYEVTRILGESLSLEEAAPALVRVLTQELRWDVGALWKVDPVAHVLRCVQMWQRPGADVSTFLEESRGQSFAQGVGIAGRAWAQGEPMWVPDMMAEPNLRLSELVSRVGLRAGIAFPIACSREVKGVMEFFSRVPHQPDEELLRMMMSIGGQIGQFIERKCAEDQLSQSQKVEAVGRMAGGIAHDFNNLLTVITGYCELMLGDVRSGDHLYEPIVEIAESARRAAKLTQHLLIVSRKTNAKPIALDPNRTIGEMVAALRNVLGEDVALRTYLDPEAGHVFVDPAHFELVLVHLASNARDAMPGGGTFSIQTSNADLDVSYAVRRASVKPGPYVRITISDTGSGMDAKTQAKIFDPFFTTKERGKATGLGLSIVEGIVASSGGYIWLYSEPGLGTTFKIYLPRRERPQRSTGLSPAVARPPRGSETVLLVEDEDRLRKLAKNLLETHGYTVIEAANGEEAIMHFEQRAHDIDLLLTDIVMPGLKGPEIAKRLRDRRRGLKVLYMSGYTDHDVTQHGILEPGTPFLSKPFTMEEFFAKVRDTLEGPSDATEDGGR